MLHLCRNSCRNLPEIYLSVSSQEVVIHQSARKTKQKRSRIVAVEINTKAVWGQICRTTKSRALDSFSANC